MMACWPMSWTTVNPPKPSQWPMESGRVMSWPWSYSAWFFQPCSLTPLETGLGVGIRYRTNGKLFNPKRIEGEGDRSQRLLFADNCTASASHKQEMQVGMDSFSSACNNICLTISTKKTKMMFQPAPGNKYHKLQISVNGQSLRAVETFTYLGSSLSHNVNIDSEINNRISKASSTFGRLRVNVWERKGISFETKLKVYWAVILTTLLYGSETSYRRHVKTTKPLPSQMPLLSSPHPLAGQNLWHRGLEEDKLSWHHYHHAQGSAEMGWSCLLHARWSHSEAATLWRTLSGQAHSQRAKKTIYGQPKVSLKDFNISTESWNFLASDRPSWHNSIVKRAHTAEKCRSLQSEWQCAACKARTTSTYSTASTHPICPTCGRGFLGWIGLISHLLTLASHLLIRCHGDLWIQRMNNIFIPSIQKP